MLASRPAVQSVGRTPDMKTISAALLGTPSKGEIRLTRVESIMRTCPSLPISASAARDSCDKLRSTRSRLRRCFS
jgi:hypothetical protein